MTPLVRTALFIFAATLACTAPARADTAESSCEIYHNGEHNKQSSGDCIFSQRQGFIGITLKDGTRFDLTPGEHMEYTDGDGHRVRRSVDDSGQNTFDWQDRKIVLTFGRPKAAQRTASDGADSSVFTGTFDTDYNSIGINQS